MYDVDIRRTTHGVAHIRGADLPSVAFGQGYAGASDHMATIADQVVKVRSERSHFFGAGMNECHINSDFGYKALGVRDWAREMASTQPAEIVDVVEAYAAGVNRWLADHGADSVAEWARDAPWVRPLSAIDLFSVYADPALMG
jgi:acyl-homoserine-lactone acylase